MSSTGADRTEEKRVRERGGLWKVGYTTMASAPNSSLRGAVGFKKSSSASMATLSHTPWFIRP